MIAIGRQLTLWYITEANSARGIGELITYCGCTTSKK
ncbi:hypothetical protein C1752_02756 [Acaryochloris thomasi RCC1774]|uniref:Uncharacterized protein n=1 Tax=Acaryochloris thomasi RCC1774 TaxID=1764569 RepID=A0A2W1JI03_9CYAN|nr:hypothetical protein C1752_02756 [Acaryochloris thomasi RCC1774]